MGRALDHATWPLTTVSAVLGADVALNNTSTVFDGPSVAQGTVGTWLVTGQVTISDTGGLSGQLVKLWDGTTVIASGRGLVTTANGVIVVSLSGVITNPAGNLRISVADVTTTTGFIKTNLTGYGKDSTITAVRIG